jgi:phosphoinositide-3-kinase, regulatory subunit 4
MDIFSLGCVIAELFLEGTPLFSLSQMFKYRKGEYDPVRLYVDKIEDNEIKVEILPDMTKLKSLVRHMIAVDPKDRYTAEKYLQEWYASLKF